MLVPFLRIPYIIMCLSEWNCRVILTESVSSEQDTLLSLHPVPRNKSPAGTALAFPAEPDWLPWSFWLLPANLRIPNFSGWPLLRNDNYYIRLNHKKLLKYGLSFLTYTNGNFKRLNLLGVQEGPNMEHVCSQKAGYIKHDTHFSHCFVFCFPDFLRNQKLDNSFYKRHVRRLRNMKKLISGETNDKSENGILKML